MFKISAVAIGTVAAVAAGVPNAAAAPIENAITGLTVAPSSQTQAGYCLYDVTVDVTHRGPVHIDALATDGTTNYGGGNIDIRGSGSYSFHEVVDLPTGVTARFFGDIYRHKGPNKFILLAYREETSTRTCS